MGKRAVIWDFGGVFTTSPFEAFNRYEREHGIPIDFIRRLNATDPDDNAWARFERSEIGLEEFDRLFEAESRRGGHPIPGRVVVQLLAGDIRPRMVAALKRCKTRLACACITNNFAVGEGPGMTFSEQRSQAVADVMALFDLVVESSRVGFRKPDPRIYVHTCEALDIAPADAVYLDDLGVNLKPARTLGMTTIKVVDPDAALAELEAALGFGLRDD